MPRKRRRNVPSAAFEHEEPPEPGAPVEPYDAFNNPRFDMDMFIIVPLLALVGQFVLKNFDRVNPKPYMDEIFHIPQTQRYCNFTFSEWDPKITTLPGTYIVSAYSLICLEFASISNGCTTYNLRAFNIVLGLVNFVLIVKILPYYAKKFPSRFFHYLTALNLYLFPVLYFFNFFSYTDVTSTMFLLIMHHEFLKGHRRLSAFSGAFAVLTRQTNIMFVGWHNLLTIQYLIQEKNLDIGFRVMLNALTRGVYLGRWYAAVCAGFVAFVIWNGSVVVGDKSAHTAMPNFPQLGYFAIVYGVFTFPYLLCRLKSTLSLLWRRRQWWKSMPIFACLFLLAVYFNTVEHPYLLADNRHYTFYFWRRIYKSTEWLRYALVPYYVYIYAFILSSIHEENIPHIVLLLMISVPTFCLQSLLEFRYFIPTFIFARMMMYERSKLELICEFLLVVSVNLFTFYMYMYKPFEWPGTPGLQRFMW